MHKAILILSAMLVAPAWAAEPGPATLPSIDKLLPYGVNVISLPPAVRRNDTSPRTVALLAADLVRPGQTVERRVILVSDLGATDLPQALEPLKHAAGDASAQVRAAVGMALAKLHLPESGEVIGKLMTDESPAVRAEAVRAAGAIGRGDLVTAGLNDADPNVVAAAESVATIEQAAAVSARLRSDNDAIQVLALRAMGRIGDKTQAGATAALLSSDSLPTRIAAIDTLAALKATEHAPAIVQLLKNDHPTIRRQALTALLQLLPAEQAQTHAITMLKDADPTVQTAAAIVLANAPTALAVDPLVLALSSDYPPLHDAARSALVAIGSASVPAAESLLGNADPRRREDGSYVLGMLASHAGYDKHLQLLDDADWRLVQQVAVSMGQIGDVAAGPALVKTVNRSLDPASLTTSPDMQVRFEVAIDALVAGGKIGYAPMGDLAATIFPAKTTSSQTRAAAIWVVGAVGASNTEAAFAQFPGLIADRFEAAEVKVEALKAIGNRRYAKGMPQLQEASVQFQGGSVGAMVHWCIDRLNGKVTPFINPPKPWRADVSITDTEHLK
jgi:HEAT repeat protein